MYIVLYFGPYAAWEFTYEERTAIPDPIWDAIFDFEGLGSPLAWNIGINGVLGVNRSGRSVGRYCLVPREDRPGGSQRPMLFEWHLDTAHFSLPEEMATDWGALDREGELAWFRSVFAAELERLSVSLGRSPQLCWGVVHWHS